MEESHPSIVGGCSSDSGGSNQPLRKDERTTVPSGDLEKTGHEGNKCLIFHRSRLQHSPVRPRAHSIGDVSMEETTGSKKRKAEESPRLDYVRKEKNKVWSKMKSKIKELNTLINDNPKKRKEIKKVSGDLQSLIAILNQLDREVEEHRLITQTGDQEMVNFKSSKSNPNISVATQTEADNTNIEDEARQTAMQVENIRRRISDNMEID